MEKKIEVSSLSEIKQTTGLSATVLFDTNEPKTYRAETLEEVKIFDGTPGLDGELLISTKQDCDFVIDINGNLLVLHEKADNYSVDEEGNLIYNF